MTRTIAVLDFGSQYTQVIARRIRECNVYSKIYPYSITAKQLLKENVCGIILSGGPSSVLKSKAPLPDKQIFKLGIPVLGICYGLQLIAYLLNGKVASSDHHEYGRTCLLINKKSKLLHGIKNKINVWNSHGDKLIKLPRGFEPLASTENSDFAVIQNEKKDFYGLQFHPEVSHTEQGSEIYKNFLFKICKCEKNWSMSAYIESTVQGIREIVGSKHVILGLSGGVDSSVAAALIHKAIGNQLTCIFVDNGLLRLNERVTVEQLYKKNFQLNLKVVNASAKFLVKLKGVKDPERKRKIIGKVFIEVFEDSIKSIKDVSFLAQGTLYPDVIESVPIDGNPSSLIKSHHNVGGLPKRMRLKLLEPLRELFKDEVRALGSELGLPKEVLWRQPFPGPGLSIRVISDVTRHKLNILRKADSILLDEMKKSKFYYKVWQSFAVLLPVKSVGVMGDKRTYENVVALRIVESCDAMTADWANLPQDLLKRISNRIINEVRGVNRVCLDISSKPPGTIEWE